MLQKERTWWLTALISLEAVPEMCFEGGSGLVQYHLQEQGNSQAITFHVLRWAAPELRPVCAGAERPAGRGDTRNWRFPGAVWSHPAHSGTGRSLAVTPRPSCVTSVPPRHHLQTATETPARGPWSPAQKPQLLNGILNKTQAVINNARGKIFPPLTSHEPVHSLTPGVIQGTGLRRGDAARCRVLPAAILPQNATHAFLPSSLNTSLYHSQ